MKNTFILILFLVFGFVSAQIPKGKLLIIGGGDSPDFLIDRMVKEAGLKRRICSYFSTGKLHS